ncbi:DMT family transporter [Candidatus Woesearchaeota archaeon]|nr:DMT family transporter [Candidatus Woesearchaeota archaeon]
MDDKLKGYLFVTIAIFFIALSAVAIKIVQQNNGPETSSFFWTLSSLLTCSVLLFVRKEQKKVIPALKHSGRIILPIGILVGIGMLCWFHSINLIGPSLSSFLGRIGTIVLVFLSILFLKEKFNIFEAVGTIIALGGVLLITFSPIEYLGWKITYIAIGSTCYGISQLISKKYIQMLPLVPFTFLTTFISTLMLFANSIITSKLKSVSLSSLPIILIVPFLSEVIAVLLIYSSYRYLGVGKVQIIRSSFPFVVVVYSFLFYNEVPLPHQLIGGTLIVLGVMMLIGFRRIKKGVGLIFNSS